MKEGTWFLGIKKATTIQFAVDKLVVMKTRSCWSKVGDRVGET